VAFCQREAHTFRSDTEVLDAARLLFDLRVALSDDDSAWLAELTERVAVTFHEAIGNSGDDVYLPRTLRKFQLARTEREIVLVLTLAALGDGPVGISGNNGASLREIQRATRVGRASNIELLKALGQGGRLASTGLLLIKEGSVPADTQAIASPTLLHPLIQHAVDVTWDVKNYEDLLDRCYALVRQLSERAEHIRDLQRGGRLGRFWREGTTEGENRAIARLWGTLCHTAEAHREWPIHGFLQCPLQMEEKLIVIALLGKDLGFLSPDAELFTGQGLARCVSEDVPSVRHNLEWLRRDRPLRASGYIRVCGGLGDVATEDDATLSTCEFELTQEFAEKLQIKRRRKSSSRPRPPLVRMDQLVLSEEVRAALNMAVAQVQHKQVILETWGLAETVAYGRGVVLLFYGPPGTGKTASAEALADRLGKPIIVANYAEIQNCFVGMTEKNIVRTFREAADADALLLWDEADAMFYDRDTAFRNWEVRDVNVLLQELERLQGICILSTNRQVTLDKALERRIAIKVRFDPPDRAMRRGIWERLLPAKLPLADDVNLDELAGEELTGGEIKNVVLNAARLALCRDPNGKVARGDFLKAIAIEREGKWSGRARAGFK